MASRIVFKALGALLALTFTFASAAGLPKEVERALRAAGIPQSSVAAVVQEVSAGRPLLAVNAAETRNPASVMKLITTYAALELLGPAYRWKTEAYLDGADLVLRGYGDPKLNQESFWMLLRNLRGRGLADIRGDVVLDRSWFAPVEDGRIDNDVFRPYNVAPDALLVNFKSLRFNFLPEAGGVRVFAEPALPGLEIVNSLRTVEGNCPEGRAFRELIQASFEPRPPRASFTGLYPTSCAERDLNVALYAPEEYVEAMIRQLWRELGGSWSGKVRAGTVSASARLVYRHDSAPLAEIVRDINKFSNNVMARQLYLTLAAELGGAPARPENARHAIRQWLDLKKIRAPELVIENGSGLSRIERASAATVAALLQAAWRSAVMPEFVASLPVAAADGTMRKRLLGERVAGQAHIKTGLLQDARSMAGYVLDRHGRRHVVVMIVNHPRAPESQAAQDALLAWVYEGATGPAATRAGPRGGGPRRP
ncbi:MAG: D-alanyl-D-alanine carboxypeptidase/D-alanyl-D-alanine-endopeptidase [Betaproteobacteria bacterium RIFCSPLOWO2_12_FULL_65_14]|nr:MAG: D-alanyl-D-alanine carboxypeptidase/D-alanyl-D-alanine-endopeptidase [Betaproteobacteria bacterium RIFCSPLOWO2_12_FULL_65_14]